MRVFFFGSETVTRSILVPSDKRALHLKGFEVVEYSLGNCYSFPLDILAGTSWGSVWLDPQSLASFHTVHPRLESLKVDRVPKGAECMVFTYIWLQILVNVLIHSIHGASGVKSQMAQMPEWFHNCSRQLDWIYDEFVLSLVLQLSCLEGV